MDMNNDAEFEAALRTFEQSHPDAATWVHWLWEQVQTHTARLAAVEADQQEIRAIQRHNEEQLYQLEIFREDYEALSTAHEALQLEHADLEASYFVLQRRVSKEE